MSIYERAKADNLESERTSPYILMKKYALSFEHACTLCQMLRDWGDRQDQPFKKNRHQKPYKIVDKHMRMLTFSKL